jgi:hypothetical protein
VPAKRNAEFERRMQHKATKQSSIYDTDLHTNTGDGIYIFF